MKRFVLCLLVIPSTIAADEVVLRGGGRLTGIIVEHSARSIVIETGRGRITLPLARVERIVPGASPLDSYRRRAKALSATDVKGWLDLALWAQDVGLATQARAAFEHVVALEPGNAAAQRGLGNVLLDDRWVSPEESFRARGYVLFEGSWVTPAERESALAEQAARNEAIRAEQDRTEAAARAREAEARARTAEAEARRAEADARAAETGGVPLWGSFGPGFVTAPPVFPFCPICRHRHAPGSCTGVAPPPPQRPAPAGSPHRAGSARRPSSAAARLAPDRR